MSEDTPAARLRENATSVATTVVTGIWLAALFTGQEWWLAALIVGYVAVIPLVALLFGDEGDRDERRNDWTDGAWWGWEQDSSERGVDAADAEDAGADDDSLATLRRRYAEGELTDEQFERKLERLLETETLEDAEESAAHERLRERNR